MTRPHTGIKVYPGIPGYLAGTRVSGIETGPRVPVSDTSQALTALLLARLMGQYCFAGWRLSSSSVTLPACGLAGCMGGRAADTARWASTVSSR